MIGGAVTGSGGAALGRHLVNPDHNEDVRAGESRGLMAETVDGQVAELTDMAEASGHKAPLRHVHASPPPGTSWDEGQWDAYWMLYERAMGLEECAFSEAIHDKPGADGRPPHRHRVYLAMTERGTLVRIGHDYARQEAVSRITEADTGAAFVKGAHNIRAAAIARSLGRDDVADAMQAAGLLDGARARADLSPTDRAQQERTHVTKASVAASVAQAWAASDGGPAFAAALAEQGLRLAQGDKCPVIVDSTGNSHSLQRMLAMDARATGTDAPRAGAIAARLDGMALPSVSQARKSIAAQAPGQPPDDGPPAPDAPPPPEGGQDAPGAGDVAHAHTATPTSHGGDAPAPAAVQAAPGAALEDAGPGPGEPPGPGAHPDELARYRAALAAHQDRKASAWMRWLAQQAAGPHAPSGGGGHAGHAEIAHGQHGKAAAQALTWIRAAQEGGATRHDATPAAGVGPSASEDGDDHAGSGGDEAVRDDHPGDAHAGGGGVEPAARPDDAQPVRGAKPDRGPDTGRAGDSGEPAAAGNHARTAVRRAAATRHLEGTLASMPAAMKALRRACAELSPEWRAGRDAHARIMRDRMDIAAILATHPHPDPADRDPAARADTYAHAISDRTRQRAAEVDAAQAQAVAAVQGRSRMTRALAFIGMPTAAQRQAERMVAYAAALAVNAADTLPSRDDYRRARASGEAHAYAAQQTTAAWEARPDVAAAMEQHRLNQAVQQAMDADDQAIREAMAVGDPEAARAIVRAREQEKERRQAEQDKLEQLRRGTPGHDGTRPPSPGRK